MTDNSFENIYRLFLAKPWGLFIASLFDAFQQSELSREAWVLMKLNISEWLKDSIYNKLNPKFLFSWIRPEDPFSRWNVIPLL